MNAIDHRCAAFHLQCIERRLGIRQHFERSFRPDEKRESGRSFPAPQGRFSRFENPRRVLDELAHE
jgi:hypothetical protein